MLDQMSALGHEQTFLAPFGNVRFRGYLAYFSGGPFFKGGYFRSPVFMKVVLGYRIPVGHSRRRTDYPYGR